MVLVVTRFSRICGVAPGMAAVHRSVLQSLISVDAILRSLHGDVVVDAVFGIEPEGRSGLKAGAERDQNVLCDVAGLHADGLRASAIDIHEERRRVKGLLDVYIHGAGNVAHLRREFLRDDIVARLVGSGDGDVDGRGSTEVQNLGDDVGGLKEKLHAGISVRQHGAKLVDVFGGALAAFALELNQNFGVGSADGAGVAVAEIDAAVGKADVVENGDQFLRRNDLADGLIDLIGEARGLFNAQSGAGAHVQADLAGVDFGEKVAAEHK